MRTVEIEVGDKLYELEVVSIQLPGNPSWDDPGDPGEVELGNIVTVYDGTAYTQVTTFNVFLLEYAAASDMSLRDAERAIMDCAWETVSRELADEYEDSRMSYAERDY